MEAQLWEEDSVSLMARRYERSILVLRKHLLDAQVGVHLRREQREGGTEERSQHRVGGEDRGGEDGVGVDKVVHDAEEDQDHAKAESVLLLAMCLLFAFSLKWGVTHGTPAAMEAMKLMDG